MIGSRNFLKSFSFAGAIGSAGECNLINDGSDKADKVAYVIVVFVKVNAVDLWAWFPAKCT